MSFGTYRDVRPWAKAIREQVVKRAMPPFGADGTIGRFVDDPRLTDEEIFKISKWVDLGAPPGPPMVREMEARVDETKIQRSGGWRMGPPDVVLKMDPYEVQPDVKDQYIIHLLDKKFGKDLWVGSVDIRHKENSVVHHANVFLVGRSWIKGRGLLEPGQHNISNAEMLVPGLAIYGWLPGMPPRADTPPMHLLADYRIALSIHYAPRETPATVESEIGFYAFTGKVDQVWRSIMHTTDDINIAPADPNYVLNYEEPFSEDALIQSYNVHMHLRGRSSKVSLIYPDGHSECAFDIPRFNFYWQRDYQLAKPIPVPKGTRVRFEVRWDNSAANPTNPDPTKRVIDGFRSEDEMWISALSYTSPEPDCPRIWIVKGRRIAVEDPKGDQTIWRDNHYAL